MCWYSILSPHKVFKTPLVKNEKIPGEQQADSLGGLKVKGYARILCALDQPRMLSALAN